MTQTPEPIYVNSGNLSEFLKVLAKKSTKNDNYYLHSMYSAFSELNAVAHESFNHNNQRFDRIRLADTLSKMLYYWAQITLRRDPATSFFLYEERFDLSNRLPVDAIEGEYFVERMRPILNLTMPMSLGLLCVMGQRLSLLDTAVFAPSSPSVAQYYRSPDFFDDLLCVYASIVYLSRWHSLEITDLYAMSIEGAAKELNAQAEIQEVSKIHIRPE